MKNLLLICLTLGIILITQQDIKAQQTYKNAIGGRLGTANGITYKTFINSDRALDFILNFRSNEKQSTFRFTGLYEIHNPINNAPGLRWYYGPGATVGSRKFKSSDTNDLLVSLDGVLGLDYKFADAPINLALDWKPAIEIVPNTEFDAQGFGLSIRFTF
ncbi:MAG: hypothetical protein H7096_12465 [Flavobacterium sp.]|nr:hypothetical protein [Pedobacter sp.]